MDLQRLFDDPAVRGGRNLPLDRISRLAEGSLRQWTVNGFGPWAAIDKATGSWIGRIGLDELDDWPGVDKIEVGFELHRAWWGRGLATEGALAALEFGFERHGLQRVISITAAAHAAARRVMEKQGSRTEGHGTGWIPTSPLFGTPSTARPGRRAGRRACGDGVPPLTERMVHGYAEAAADLIPRFEAVSSSELYAKVARVLPVPGSRVIDIGAGTGRDAAWFAARGCRVLAVEPVVAFRKVGATLHQSPYIEWLDDSLPTLAQVLQREETFDFVLLSAVWQHVDDQQRQLAMPNLRALTAPEGRLLLSVRHGPGVVTRPCFPASVEDAIRLAHANGFRLICRRSAASMQPMNRQAGVTWTWLAFSAT